MSQPQKQDCHTLQLVDLARPFLVSPAIKIEIENSLEMALSKAKSGRVAIPFLAVWNLATCSKHASSLHYANHQSWVLFKQQAFNATGEDRLWESKFYIPFQPQKWASNKSNSSVTSSCASCGFLRSRLESQSWNSFNSFPIVNGVPAGVPTPPDSGKTPQLKTSKLAQNCGKTEVLHLQPSYGICWSHEIETLPPM